MEIVMHNLPEQGAAPLCRFIHEEITIKITLPTSK